MAQAADEKQEVLDLSKKMTLQDVKDDQIAGKRVFLRADFNVPLDKKSGEITDQTRITATIPTLVRLLNAKPARLAVTSHLGRPAGNSYVFLFVCLLLSFWFSVITNKVMLATF